MFCCAKAPQWVTPLKFTVYFSHRPTAGVARAPTRPDLTAVYLAAHDLADDAPESGVMCVHRGKGQPDRVIAVLAGTHAALADWLIVHGAASGSLVYGVVKGGCLGPRRLASQALVMICCWRQDDLLLWREGWLIGEQPARGQASYPRWYWSNFLPETPLERLVVYAHRRHQVDRFHQDSKTLLRWDQYQGRRWDAFHRHAILVMLSYSFLVWQEWQQREQRCAERRHAFSPSPGSAPAGAGGHVSAYPRLSVRTGH